MSTGHTFKDMSDNFCLFGHDYGFLILISVTIRYFAASKVALVPALIVAPAYLLREFRRIILCIAF